MTYLRPAQVVSLTTLAAVANEAEATTSEERDANNMIAIEVTNRGTKKEVFKQDSNVVPNLAI